MVRSGSGETPQRSCLGCRVSKDKSELLRFIQTPETEILPDLENRLPGRGAYTCLHMGCVTQAIERKQFKRSFKQDVVVMPAAAMVGHIRALLFGRVTGLIGLANKAGKIVSGGTMVGEALKNRTKPGLVLIASDVSEAIGDKIIHAAGAHNVPWRRAVTKDEFGEILGKAPRSAIAVASGGFVAQLLKSVDRYRNFLGEV